MQTEAPELWQKWREAVNQPPVVAELRAIHERVDAAVRERGPTCWTSGNCCRFESYGHRMYLTGLEVSWFLSRSREASAGDRGSGIGDRNEPHHHRTTLASSPDPRSPVPDPRPQPLPLLQTAPPADACPYLRDHKCTVHAIRPLGCRVFFCQRGQEAWQGALYESMLDEVKRLHERFDLPYRYMEWRAALAEAAEAAYPPLNPS